MSGWRVVQGPATKDVWYVMGEGEDEWIADVPTKEIAEQIATLPDLLAALRAVVADYQYSAGNRPMDKVYAAEHPVMGAIAAIAKATGAAS